MTVKIADIPALIRATLAVVFSGFRVGRSERNAGFDEMIEFLRMSTPMIRCDPGTAGRVIGRLLKWIPPNHMGPCMKRSLILLHLWSAEGIDVRLHLGVIAGSTKQSRGHAWLTSSDPSLECHCGNPQGRIETYDG